MPRYTREECAAAAAEIGLPEADELRQIRVELEAVEDRRQGLLDRRAETTRILFGKDVSRRALAGLTGLSADGVDAIRRRE